VAAKWQGNDRQGNDNKDADDFIPLPFIPLPMPLFLDLDCGCAALGSLAAI
jgi:hypothetical protein